MLKYWFVRLSCSSVEGLDLAVRGLPCRGSGAAHFAALGFESGRTMRRHSPCVDGPDGAGQTSACERRFAFTRHHPACLQKWAKIGVCCIFDTPATALKRRVDERKCTLFTAHGLPHPDRLTFAVLRPARIPFPHREDRFHTGY